MYRCLKCGNRNSFEEINVYKTYISQDINNSSDEFFYKENVICLECNSSEEDGEIINE